ncbi:MAG TPA: hypothetical protein P5205_11635 [Candidatus Paceibacterota bacterium]|nr:hypothetical protein [Verrucomicrobiota bacterium]HSA11010.1 hypothetical protein [Candidatus Paceibacterota bacterium]
MKLACLLSVGPGAFCFLRGGNPFRLAESGRLPYLVSAAPVDLAPVRPALEAGAVEDVRSQPAGWAGRVEACVLKSLVILFVLTVLAGVFGAQHITYTREKHNLGRQLRQKETELTAVTQACRSLECEKARWLALGVLQPTAGLGRADSAQRTVTGKAGESARGRDTKPVSARAAAPSRRPQVADARTHTRRGGTGG